MKTISFRALSARLSSWEGLLAALTLLLFGYGAIFLPNFATPFNIAQIAAGVSEKALLVLPMVLLIIAREIDLSVASILGLCSVMLGMCLRSGVDAWLCLAITFAVGAAAGTFNGVLVTRLGLPSLVVTLGTMALFRGIGYMLLGTASVNVLPDALTTFGIETILGGTVPWTIVPFILLAPVFGIYLHGTAFGRRVFAIGGNPDAALYSGIPVRKVRMTLFVISGLVCALASVVLTARLSNARANNGLGFELDVITIALLGGVNVFGGHGKLIGVVWALMLVALIRNVLGIQQVGGDAQGVAIGLLLILSLLLSNGIERLRGLPLVQRWTRKPDLVHATRRS